jgi:hypothetical protein
MVGGESGWHPSLREEETCRDSQKSDHDDRAPFVQGGNGRGNKLRGYVRTARRRGEQNQASHDLQTGRIAPSGSQSRISPGLLWAPSIDNPRFLNIAAGKRLLQSSGFDALILVFNLDPIIC